MFLVLGAVEGGLVARPASAQLAADGKTLTVTTANATATFAGPDLVRFVNTLTGESYLTNPSTGQLAAVDTIGATGQSLQPSNWTLASDAGTGLPVATITTQDASRSLTLTVRVDPASQEIVLRLSATTAIAGLRGASWSLAGLNLEAGRLIVPAHSGIVIDRAHPALDLFLEYPNTWHAQMAVYEAAQGSVVLYSTDAQMAFKRLQTSTRGEGTVDVAMATEAVAPFTTATTVPAIEWRLKAFGGNWRVAADTYRTWLAANRPPASNAAHPWVSSVQAVVNLPSDQTLLAPLAAVVTPAQTLLYLTDWRLYDYDVNYPDYTPRPGVAGFIAAAHARGFKVMLHVDLIGVSPGHPDYAALKAYQVRTAESLELTGWRWDRPVSTPYRFAYINPASNAYRSLFVSRLGAGLSGLAADALHLDISGPMSNDGNGPIDGRTYPQGSAQLHQDLIAAFPGMALGGEGENDVVARYQSFAQAWWPTEGPPFTSPGHPLANFLFSPQVQYYGHLTQPSAQEGAFKPYLVALEHRGILPMIKVYSAQQLDAGDPDNARLFAIVNRWQTLAFRPAWSADWGDAIVKYEGLSGSTASLADTGTVLTLTAAGTPLFQLAHDTNQAASQTYPRHWPAFDDTTLFGLDAQGLYFLDSVPRPTTTHLSALPPGVRIGSGTHVAQTFAHFELLPPVSATFDFNARFLLAKLGITFQGAAWPLAYGAVVRPAAITAGGTTRSGLFIHPPFEGQLGGETFIEYPVPVPAGGMFTFSVGVADDATCTDGATFRVTANGSELWRQHVLRTGWQDVSLSLAAYAGTTVSLRLISNPGPAANPSCDWTLWTGMTLTGSASAIPVSVPVALAPGSVVAGFDGDGIFSPGSGLTGSVSNLRLPGRFTLFTAAGAPVVAGTNLTTIPFQTWLWAHDQVAVPGSIFNSGAVGSIASGGVTKSPSIFAHPPAGGSAILSWVLRLPSTGALRINWSAGLADGSTSEDGVDFTVRINGTPYWRSTIAAHGWNPGSLDLSPWKGQNILVELVTDARGTSTFDWAYWADLSLTASATSCTYSVPAGATIPPGGGTFTVTVTASATCPWSAVSSAPEWLTVTTGSGSGTGTVTYTVAPNAGPPRVSSLVIGGQQYPIVQGGALPTMTIDRTSLRFGGVSGSLSVKGTTLFVVDPVTAPQVVRVTQSGSGSVTWTASSDRPWMLVSPASGSGTGDLTISIVGSGAPILTSPADATVTITFTGASTTTAAVAVTLTHFAATAAKNPFGTVDTPTNNRTGVTGAIPFTGWALDDIEVARVMICRAAFGGEVAPVDPNCGGAAQVFVGYGVFIDGARPDVAATYPTYPLSTRAGWGFMVLTNMLPAQGNGTYQFTIYAQDRDGHTVTLGTRTISCTNATATLPFGAIDTPTQGGLASGNSFVNFGWALTPQPKTIPVDGSTIQVLIDGVVVGKADYNHARSDIQALFPGLNNTDGAIGFRVLDTTGLTNGLHTISWIVTDNQGATEGIGSRFFTVSNGASAVTAAAVATDERATQSRLTTVAEIEALPLEAPTVLARRGWDLEAPYQRFASGATGRLVIRSEEVNRVELLLPTSVESGSRGASRYAGYLRTGETLAPLPVGSTFDPVTGRFTWAPGLGFVGTYDFVFIRSDGGRAVARQDVRIVLQPQGSGPR